MGTNVLVLFLAIHKKNICKVVKQSKAIIVGLVESVLVRRIIVGQKLHLNPSKD